MEEPLGEVQAEKRDRCSRASGNHQGGANGVSQVNVEHRFGSYLPMLS